MPQARLISASVTTRLAGRRGAWRLHDAEEGIADPRPVAAWLSGETRRACRRFRAGASAAVTACCGIPDISALRSDRAPGVQPATRWALERNRPRLDPAPAWRAP